MVDRPTRAQQFTVLSFDRKTGKQRWSHSPRTQLPHEGHHKDHGFASASPDTGAGGGGGRAKLLTALPERLVHAPLDLSMTRAALMRELNEARERGWTELVDTARRGIGAAAVAVGSPQGRTIGIALCWMERDMSPARHRRTVAELLGAARTVGRRVRDPYWLPPEER
jgi:hypothetical protein